LLLSAIPAPLRAGRESDGADLRPSTLSTPDSEDEFIDIAPDGHGGLWAVWQSWDGTDDAVLGRHWTEGHWGSIETISASRGDYHRPQVTAWPDGRAVVVWAANEGGNVELVARWRDPDGSWSQPKTLTDNPFNDFHHKLVLEPSGQCWIVWQAVIDGQYDVLAAALDPEGLGEPVRVTEHPASDREPNVAATDTGLAIVWDSYRNGSYDIYLRMLSGGELGPLVPMAASPNYEAHASVTVDRQGRVWVAWDDGGANWGQHPPPSGIVPGERLHAHRTLGLRGWAAGHYFEPEVPLASILEGPMAQFAELPQIACDSSGRIHLLFRHLKDITDGRHKSRGIWNVFLTTLSGAGWSRPLMMPDSNGRNDQRADLLVAGDGLWVAWSDDGRLFQRPYVPVLHRTHAVRLPLGDLEAARIRSAKPVQLAVLEARGKPGPRPTLTIGDKQLTLLYGDTHRHTDISHCGMNFDGSLLDTYRYAQDVVELDFLAISDHDRDLLKHRHDRTQRPRQEYAWWRSQKYCDLLHVKERFLPIYGYEYGGPFEGWRGHKNVLYARREGPCLDEPNPAALFRALEGYDAVVIPHQLADGPARTNWDEWDERYEVVAEIYQARGSYEYPGAPLAASIMTEDHSMWDALAKGHRVGIIASSDHRLVHDAYAGVWVEEPTRSGILAGLRARRTTGSTDKILAVLRTPTAMMGDQIGDAATPPAMEITVRATAPIARLDIVRSGRFVFTREDLPKSVSLRFTDTSPDRPAAGYYYLRVIQEGGETAWTSPIWWRTGADE
jgi:hypothetical protein